MTRQIVYGAALWLFMASIALTLAAIILPEWVAWDAYPDESNTFWPGISAMRGPAKPVHYTYGIHSRCDSVSDTCTPFPRKEDCGGPESKFCTEWRTAGFLMSVTVVLELAGLVGFAIVMLGGIQKRVYGWKILVLIIGICVACQATSMSLIEELHETDDHFFPGWYLSKSFTLCVVSWCVQLGTAVGLAASAFLLPEEGGYELIPDRERVD